MDRPATVTVDRHVGRMMHKRLDRERTHGCAIASACALSVCCLVGATALAADSPLAELVVVTDINYPPYLFSVDDAEPVGILRDKWDLWSKRTGVGVRMVGMSWTKAQQSIQNGTADVIEALAYTEARAQLYEFSPPYSTIEARIFFHQTIRGISDVASLRGFTVGAKDGSACANWLAERGVDTIRRY